MRSPFRDSHCNLLCAVVLRMRRPAHQFFLSMLALVVLCPGCGRQERHWGREVARETPVTLSVLVSNPDRYLDKPLVVQGRIGSVCQTTGCWFVLQEGKDQLYVSLTSFTLPRNVAGESCRAAGRLIMRDERLTFLATGIDLLHE